MNTASSIASNNGRAYQLLLDRFEEHHLTLTEAKEALAGVLEVVQLYADRPVHTPFSPDQWTRMNEAMDNAKAVLALPSCST